MNVAHFIARRILVDKDRADRLSRPIVGIAVLGIVIGMAVMIVTVGITTGFQREVRAKVTGAGGHLQITSISQTDSKETPRVAIAQPFYPSLDSVPGVKHIQVFATRPGIIETDGDIQGVVLKGVGRDHDWSFLQQHLKAGTVPAIGDTARPIDILLSKYIGDRLHIGVDDTITVYLIKDHDDIRPRKFRVSGLYETGIEQLDHQLVYVDIGHLQRFAQWGLKAELMVYDTASWDGICIEGLAFGGDRIYHYEWPGTELSGKGPHWIRTEKDTTITLVVSDADHTLADTAWVRIIPDPTVMHDLAWYTRDIVDIERGGSGGSYAKYCGGFEVILDRFEDLAEMDDVIYRDHLDIRLRSLSVRQRFPEIFAWLELLDTNVVVIIVLMVIVAIINMTSALLIIILERTPMIGVLKALGSSNGAIRRIFLIDAAYILGIGILLGDLLGIGLCLIQQQFGIVTLPVESYYVDAVPVDVELLPILWLNVGTMVVCVLALILPSMLVTRIGPAEAIR
ncbi:MAG: ABC transporter permease, partial [Flavobacteriales bacterium]|nr:ABC transporter permease [Flavobacteriales bacterium]